MIIKYNYYSNNDTPLFINKELLQSYKKQGDVYLVNIKRELTRSLVDYKLFQELQQINNSFFVIIDYLDAEHYIQLKDIVNDRNTLLNNINIFLKHCKGNTITDIYNSIYENCDQLILTIHKLVEIVKTVNKGEK